MASVGDYNKIMSDRNLFNKVVYTPMSEATRLLDERRKNPELMAKVEKLLNGDIPEILKNKKCGVLCRQIVTPNHETTMFLSIAKDYNLLPFLFEYLDDKFTPENKFKHSLGQLHIQKKKDKKGYVQVERITIVDFHKYSSKKLRDVKTLEGELLVDFHRKLFNVHNYNKEELNFFDGSNWYKKNGEKAIKYYVNFFLLCTCFGILFENFLIIDSEASKFTREIVLPAIEKVIDLTGVKPLITPIGPLEIEDDGLWYHHNYKIKKVLIKT